jgi:hypothetical protein
LDLIFITLKDDFETDFAITPDYRYYFGRKAAAGFFLEGFGPLNNNSNYIEDSTEILIQYTESEIEKITDFGLGYRLSGNWLTRKGFILEINFGIGQNLFNSKGNDIK